MPQVQSAAAAVQSPTPASPVDEEQHQKAAHLVVGEKIEDTIGAQDNKFIGGVHFLQRQRPFYVMSFK